MKKIILGVFIGLFLISLTSAAISHLGTFQQNECVEIPQGCISCTYNNISRISVEGTNQSIIAEELSMQKIGILYNYSFCNTSVLGEYKVEGHGDIDGSDDTWDYRFKVTPTGKEITTGNAIIVFLAVLLFLVLGSLSLIGMIKQEKKPIKWTLGLLGFILFLAAVNLISVIIPDALINENVVSFFDSFTAISFLMFWFAFGLIAIIWFLTTLQTLLLRKTQKNIEKFA